MSDADARRRARLRERRKALQERMDGLAERAQRERGNRGWLDATFEIADRDAEVAGGIIAGALAYRLFLWLLPFGLVFVGGLGVLADATSRSPKNLGGDLGIGGIVANSVQSASNSRSPWYALIVGVPLLVYATRSVLRVLIGTHRLVWGDIRAGRPKPTFVDAAKLLGVLVGYFALAGFSGWARQQSNGVGLLVTLGAVVGFTGLWMWTTMQLPHRDAGWRDLLPGAVAVGVGIEILQVAAVYLLAPYALNKQGTYGALGLAAAVLLGLWAMGRLLIAGAEVNATLWDRKTRSVE
jgi:uncharacterized BrkB/YihY/UPF0761 family membrane protein